MKLVDSSENSAYVQTDTPQAEKVFRVEIYINADQLDLQKDEGFIFLACYEKRSLGENPEDLGEETEFFAWAGLTLWLHCKNIASAFKALVYGVGGRISAISKPHHR